MLKMFAMFLFTVAGWKQQGQMPDDIKKCIVVAVPHTSNFDLLFALAGFYKMKVPVKYLLKKEWLDFKPLRKIFQGSGAVAVDRSVNSTMVESLAELIKTTEESMALMISPEGTRKLTHKWKTGFYYTALKARVPIALSYLDYSKKLAVFGPTFMPSGCFKRDMQILKDYYKDITPKFPEKFSLEIYETDENAICTG